MKETKVYVDELPESCGECSCHSIMEDRCVLLRKQAIEPFLQSCPLQSLQIHDRELVKEVCEKIRERLSEQKKSLKDTFSPYSNGKAFIISAVEESLNKIEKEFEK